VQDVRASAIRGWMTSSPCGPAGAIAELFRRFQRNWNLSYVEATAEDVFALVCECFSADAQRGWTDMRVSGVVGPDEFQGFETEPPYEWWGQEVRGSFIQVWVGDGSHLLGKVGEDNFLLLVHKGGVAEQIAQRGCPPPRD